jgi:hypothetical protein
LLSHASVNVEDALFFSRFQTFNFASFFLGVLQTLTL